MTVEAVRDDWEGFRVILRPEDSNLPPIRILWDPAPIAYQNIDESYRLRLGAEQPQGLPNVLYTVENSSWLTQLRRAAGGVLDDIPLVHYAIYTGTDCLDLASSTPPTVTWLE